MDMTFFDEAARALPAICLDTPSDLAVILGSGWGESLTKDSVLARLSYADIPGLGAATVVGHAGEFLLYERAGRRIAAFCGRRHWYEGIGWESVVLPIEFLRRMKCPKVLLTNAAGGINPALRAGDFVILRDHLNTVGLNPLVGVHNPVWGPRFPDMSDVYTPRLREVLMSAARRCGLSPLEGVYAFTSGPVFETPAEVRAYGILGADVVGMSTVPEAVFAHACGIEVAGLSLIANPGAGISSVPLRHEDVLAATQAARAQMAGLVDDFVMSC